MVLMKKCPHGKLLTEPCGACDKMDKVERHTAQKMADLQAENEQLRAALKELVKAADPRTNMSDIPLLDALSVARAAIARAEGGGE